MKLSVIAVILCMLTCSCNCDDGHVNNSTKKIKEGLYHNPFGGNPEYRLIEEKLIYSPMQMKTKRYNYENDLLTSEILRLFRTGVGDKIVGMKEYIYLGDEIKCIKSFFDSNTKRRELEEENYILKDGLITENIVNQYESGNNIFEKYKYNSKYDMTEFECVVSSTKENLKTHIFYSYQDKFITKYVEKVSVNSKNEEIRSSIDFQNDGVNYTEIVYKLYDSKGSKLCIHSKCYFESERNRVNKLYRYLFDKKTDKFKSNPVVYEFFYDDFNNLVKISLNNNTRYLFKYEKAKLNSHIHFKANERGIFWGLSRIMMESFNPSHNL